MNKVKVEKVEKKPKILSPEELLAKYRSVLMFLRLKNKAGQLVQSHQIKQVKKDIARILTQQNQLKVRAQSKPKSL